MLDPAALTWIDLRIKDMGDNIEKRLAEDKEFIKSTLGLAAKIWPAPGSEDTELGVFMGPEVGHGETEVYTRVQA